MTDPDDCACAIECLSERGAGQVAHPGGTLLEHVRRTAARLRSWGAAPELVAAGACHAAYGTEAFPTALVAPSERGWLRARIGDHAESIVYAYCASDRTKPPNDAQRDRFTGERQQQAGWFPGFRGGGRDRRCGYRVSRAGCAGRESGALAWRRDFPPSAPAERRDFEVDARDLLRIMPGQCHVVAHSIGALSALVAAACAPERFASLVLIEPPVAWLLPDDPDVQRLVALARGYLRGDPSARSAFLTMAALPLDHPETARIEGWARKLRDPSEAAPQLDALRQSHVPAAIVSGQHEPGIERQCDALAASLGAQRWRLPGAGHAVQRHPDFNPRVLEFVGRVRPR